MTDYIEREAAIELLSQPITMSMCLSTEECHHKIAQQRIDRYLIENFLAADVRPVVRAEFVRCGDGKGVPYMCSHCGRTTPANMVEIWGVNYCPNCGANMRPESPKGET